MDTDVRQQVENTLRQQWDSLYPQIIDRFSTVSKTDIADALDTDDLVARIADKTDFSETYVEKELQELCLAGAPSGGGTQQQQRGYGSGQQSQRVPFGHSHGSPQQ